MSIVTVTLSCLKSDESRVTCLPSLASFASTSFLNVVVSERTRAEAGKKGGGP